MKQLPNILYWLLVLLAVVEAFNNLNCHSFLAAALVTAYIKSIKSKEDERFFCEKKMKHEIDEIENEKKSQRYKEEMIRKKQKTARPRVR